MTNDIRDIQLQIKAFNKALERADKAGRISDKAYELISDLIDYDRMTQGGYAKAGAKYLEAMSNRDLLSYSSDIQEAKDVLELETMEYRLDIEGAKDSKALLWKMYQKLVDEGMPFDSGTVYMVAEGKTKNVTWKDLAMQMNKYLHTDNYGLSDVMKYIDEKEGLQ